jgi:eukaryotic-like serine/threonine-protein kinase
MNENNQNPAILQEILTELKIAKEERQQILLKLEKLEKILQPETEIQINIPEKPVKKEPIFNLDYTPLAEMLKNQEWWKADQETARIMLILGNQEKQGYLTESDLYKLPGNELIKIDEMWLNASNNKFGFSVQNRLYQSLGGRKFFEPEIWRKFGETVGWYDNHSWMNYEQLNFDKNAPTGHLPVMGDGLIWFVGGWEGSFNAFSILLVKLIQFNII